MNTECPTYINIDAVVGGVGGVVVPRSETCPPYSLVREGQPGNFLSSPRSNRPQWRQL